jgi:hypothetical protein
VAVRKRGHEAHAPLVEHRADEIRVLVIALAAYSLYPPWTSAAETKRLKSNGLGVVKSTVAPSEPSPMSAWSVLWTTILLNSSDANTLKSKLRPRLLPPELSFAGRRKRFHAVQADAHELRRQAADGNLPALAAFAHDLDAGNALQRFGQVLVRELADVLGHDHIDLAGRCRV